MWHFNHMSCCSSAEHQEKTILTSNTKPTFSLLSTASCKHQQRTIKHSIVSMGRSPYNGPTTINRLYFIVQCPVKASGGERGLFSRALSDLVCLSPRLQGTASLSLFQPDWFVLSDPDRPAGEPCFSGNKEAKYEKQCTGNTGQKQNALPRTIKRYRLVHDCERNAWVQCSGLSSKT